VQTFIDLGINPSTTCIENALWTDPANFGLGTYTKGADGQGHQIDPLVLGSYAGDAASETAINANGRDLKWVQDTGNSTSFPSGAVGGRPSQGIVWNLGGQANQAVVFVQVDHGPVPGEVLENTAWLSNDPDAVDADWTAAFLTHVYGFGWMPDDVGIADGFVAVYTLPDPAATFQYVSVTWGGPGAIVRDGDDEIDAVGGLTAGGGGVVPEPASLALIGLGLAGLVPRIAVPHSHDAAVGGERGPSGEVLHGRAGGGVECARRVGVGGQRVQGHPRRRCEFDLAGVAARDRIGGSGPSVLRDLAAVDGHRAVGRGGEEEPGREPFGRLGRWFPVREGDERIRVDHEVGLLGRLADRGAASGPVRVVVGEAHAVVVVDASTREHP
jgi:hypothetical protein